MNLLKMLSASECLLLCLDVLMLSASAEGEPGSRTKVVVREGSDAILPCSLSTKENIEKKVFNWRKVDPNEQEVFRYDGGNHYNNDLPGQDEHFRGRVSHFPLQLESGNASIIIKNTVVADSGNYTCDFPRLQQKQTFSIELVVGASPKPIVHVLNITKDEALLKCEVRGAFPKPKVEWRDKDGNILRAEEPQVSHRDSRYNITLLTTVTKTNTNVFRCVATQKVIGHKTEDKLFITFCEPVMRNRSGEIHGAALKPIVHVLNITKDEALLKCEVRGAFPKPKVEWRDGDGNILPAEEPQVSHTGELYNITLLTTVTKTNSNVFRCVATQKDIGHVTEDKLYVPFCGTSGQVIISIHLLVGWFIGILSFALVLAVLVATRTISIRANRGFLRNVNSSSEETTAPGSETGPEELQVLRNGSVV
ncbi:unnamed protein product [Oreochromis niloticus]|nr:unnamed protein product [Mustela putorius furo]